MKRPAFVLSAFITLLFSISAFGETKKLTCRAGPETKVTVHVTTRMIEFTFKAGANPSPFGINPGECAFLDRPVASNEFKSVKVMIPQGVIIRAFGTHALSPDQHALNVTQLSAPGTTITWFDKLRKNNQAFSFDVISSPNYQAWMATPGTL